MEKNEPKNEPIKPTPGPQDIPETESKTDLGEESTDSKEE